jgi:hypothetical protein
LALQSGAITAEISGALMPKSDTGKTYFLKYNVGGQFDTLYPVSQEEAVAELKQTRQSK